MNRRKPCFVNLLRHLFLDICQGILPFMFNSHIPCTILHTQTYSHLWITWFFPPSLSQNSVVIRHKPIQVAILYPYHHTLWTLHAEVTQSQPPNSSTKTGCEEDRRFNFLNSIHTIH